MDQRGIGALLAVAVPLGTVSVEQRKRRRKEEAEEEEKAEVKSISRE